MREYFRFITEYLDICEFQKKLDGKTLKAYKIDLHQFKTLFPYKAIITKTDLHDYIKLLHDQYKPKTVKRKIAAVKAFFKYLEYEDYIAVNPFSKLQIKFREPFILPRTIPLSTIHQLLSIVYDELSKISQNTYKYCSILRDIAVLELLFATGMRVSELCDLSIQQVNLNEGYIKIFGKGSKERIIQIENPEVLQSLKTYEQYFFDKMSENSSFFINRLGKQLSPQSVRFMIKKYAAKASIPLHITPHMFRHSFATLLLEEDVDIRYIQHLLGHSSIATTQIYTHINAKKQKLILSSKHPRNKFALNM
jgi:integrase/recombinase XerD